MKIIEGHAFWLVFANKNILSANRVDIYFNGDLWGVKDKQFLARNQDDIWKGATSIDIFEIDDTINHARIFGTLRASEDITQVFGGLGFNEFKLIKQWAKDNLRFIANFK